VSEGGEVSVDDTYFKGEEALLKLRDISPKPTLVMFMSKTCGPCRILKPILGRVLKEYEGKVHYVEIDIEDYPDLTLQSSVAGTPTVQIYRGEELHITLRGVKKSSEYKSEIEKTLEG
jgi:thioredoxin reductase (NADPH)